MKNLLKLTATIAILMSFTSCDLTHNKYDVDKKDGGKSVGGSGDTSGGQVDGSGNSDGGNNKDNNQDTVTTTQAGPQSCELSDRLDPGLKAQLKILKEEYLTKNKYKNNIATYYDGSDKVEVIREMFLVSQVDILPRRWDEGVIHLENEVIMDPRCNRELNEHYSIDYKGYIHAPNANFEGTYQIGVISDDGVVLTIGGENLISKVKPQHPKFNCTSQTNETVTLRQGEPLSFHMVYFQGPRERVANTMVWRKVSDATDIDRSLCGNTMLDLSQFDGTDWEIIPADVLSHEGRNSCN